MVESEYLFSQKYSFKVYEGILFMVGSSLYDRICFLFQAKKDNFISVAIQETPYQILCTGDTKGLGSGG